MQEGQRQAGLWEDCGWKVVYNLIKLANKINNYKQNVKDHINTEPIPIPAQQASCQVLQSRSFSRQTQVNCPQLHHQNHQKPWIPVGGLLPQTQVYRVGVRRQDHLICLWTLRKKDDCCAGKMRIWHPQKSPHKMQKARRWWLNFYGKTHPKWTYWLFEARGKLVWKLKWYLNYLKWSQAFLE